MDDEVLDGIYGGSFENLPPLSTKIVRIFTSSTFTDMSLERNTLMEQVYPKLKEFCREKYGMEFQVVDMRWGVRDEATDDHMTTELCMREIKNCQRLSMGPNFVVFLGQKYGYRPIPTFIESKEFLNLKNTLINLGQDVSLLEKWYREDSNSIPHVHVLQPISSILINFNNKKSLQLQSEDQNTWWTILSLLQKMLRKAAWALHDAGYMSRDSVHNYMMSVTEREVINGLLNVTNTRNHCLAYVRHINNINMLHFRSASKFIDTIGRAVDIEAQDLLGELRDRRLPEKTWKSNFISFTVDWFGKDGLDKVEHQEYLHRFTFHFYKYITKLVDRAMRRTALTTTAPVVVEILQHLHACKNYANVFQGRDQELAILRDYILNSAAQPLIVHGVGGCGKTSLLAKAASLLTSWYASNQKPMLVLRFISTTPDSSSLIPLMTSIYHQVSYNYGIACKDPPEELAPLVTLLKKLMESATLNQPLCIVLDSLEQLYCSRSSQRLTWIPTSLPKYVKVILSIVSKNEEGLEDNEDFVRLCKMIDNSEQFLEVKPLGFNLAILVIKNWLKNVNRDLTATQWKVVQRAVSNCSLPIYVKLVFAEICRWRSYTSPRNATLASNVMDIIMALMDRIEIQHGRLLVSHALAYITASKSGLSESELEDLLSLDDEVLEDVYQYHLPPVRRIPPLLWTRIRNDLPNYLTEGEADGLNVLNWYHQQFQIASKERYFEDSKNTCYFHSSIADYFRGVWGGGKPKPFSYTEIQRQRFNLASRHGEADRKVPLQPSVFPSKDGKSFRYNLRKFSELPFNLVRSQRFDDLLGEILFNYLWIYNKLCCCPLQAVLADFEDATQHLPNPSDVREVVMVADTLRLGAAVLNEYPGMVAAQVISRLLPVKNIYPHIKALVNQCDDMSPQHCALVPAFHCQHTPGGPLKYSLEGHPFAVFGFVLTSNMRYIVSVSNRFIIWDITTADISQDINPNIPGIMQAVELSFDDKYAVAYTNYNLILILNLFTGDYKKITEMVHREENYLRGISIYCSSFAVWSKKEWSSYCTITGRKLSLNRVDDGQEITLVKFISLSHYYLILTTSSNNECSQVLRTFREGINISDLSFCGSLVFNLSQNNVYVEELANNRCSVSVYRERTYRWENKKVLLTNLSSVLSLTLVKQCLYLIVTQPTQFLVLNLTKEEPTICKLPDSVRNITTRVLHSQSRLDVTRHDQHVIAGIRKNLYVWDLKSGQLLRVLDAHFERILDLKAITVNDMNVMVTSSIDRSVKIWNVSNIFEEAHVIDKMDTAIESVCVDDAGQIAIIATRSSVGVWNIHTGHLETKLAENKLGAIITHAAVTGDGCYVIIIESDVLLVWDLSLLTVISRYEHPKVKQLTLMSKDTKVLTVSQERSTEAVATVRLIPDGDVLFTFVFPVFVLRDVVITKHEERFVAASMDKGKDCLMVYDANNGTFLHKIALKLEQMQNFVDLKPFPVNGQQVAVIDENKAFIYDVISKKLSKTITRWQGPYDRSGKLAIHAPPGGGLEIVELPSRNTVKSLLRRVAEGVFKVKAIFAPNGDYVFYYHGGKMTIRVFRVSDGSLIANYRLPAEVNDFVITSNGAYVVVGAADGSFTVLALVDPLKAETKSRVSALPSRACKNPSEIHTMGMFRKAALTIVSTSKPKELKFKVNPNEI